MTQIIYQNDFFVAAEKEALELTVPARFQDKDQRPVLGLKLQKHLNRQIYPVHRLDYGVSGITLFALSTEAHRAANYWFEHNQVEKVYQAITHRLTPLEEALNETSQVWKSRLLRGKKRAYEHATGKPSETIAQLIKNEGSRWYWELRPKTGRPHQLRYELFKRGFHILGDELYGSNEKFTSGLALRSVSLKLLNKEAQSRFKLPESALTVSRLF